MDYVHDGALLATHSNLEFVYGHSRFLYSQIKRCVSQTQDIAAWAVVRVEVPTSIHYDKYLFYHRPTKTFQSGEPFDLVFKKRIHQLRKEKW
jgi:hypothetical protein